MKSIKYEELKEIRRGFGILFLLITTFWGDLLKTVINSSNPLEKQILASKIVFLIVVLIGFIIILLSVKIWFLIKQGESDE